MNSTDLVLAAMSAGGSRRPRPRVQPAFAPPFDPSDEYGTVHTELPAEQVIPPHFTDPTFLRADFTGVTFEGDYTPTSSADIIAAGGITMTSGRWKGLRIPYVRGANTTPPTMLMTPMLILYPRAVQDAALTLHAERGYDDLVYAPDGWNMDLNGFTPTPANILAWGRHLQSWGFRPVLWRGDPRPGVDAMLQTQLDAGVVSFYIHGKEVDDPNLYGLSGAAYETLIQAIDQHIGGRVPIGAHFTADGDRHMGYPIGAPRDDFLRNWSLYDGRVHLCQQLDVDASAGLQGASMYYARLHVNAGIGDAAQGPGAPHSRVIGFETMSTKQLYGQCTEAYSKLRSWELACGTRDNPKCRPVSGSASGIGYPDGRTL